MENENNQLQIVTFEQAIRLKKLGFDWPCCDVYSYGNLCNSFCGNHNDWDEDDLESAPTVALALKWCRDVKRIVSHVGNMLGYYGAYKKFGDMVETWIETTVFDSYEAAESALLDELLNIIENQP